MRNTVSNVGQMIARHAPRSPVYCIYPEVYRKTTASFLSGFPGRTLYAVKANDHPQVLHTLHAAGVRHFDCASLAEIERVVGPLPGSTAYFMNPVRYRGDAATAFHDFGVRHFVVDHVDGVPGLLAETGPADTVIFARMAVSHAASMVDLSEKFGADAAETIAILETVRRAGAEPALAFNVGTCVTDPDAFRFALHRARELLNSLPFNIRLLDIGGGFPISYPGFDMPPLEDYFERIAAGRRELPLAETAELLAEPGRALAAPGVSAVTQVLLKKPGKLYLNDGMYGIFWELRFKGHRHYPFRVFRGSSELRGNTMPFRLFGPTCDSSDELPEPISLPASIREGDYIEFGCIGAYSLCGLTRFNGFYSDNVVTIGDADASPPDIDS